MEKYKVDFVNFLTTVFQITTESKHEIKGQLLKSIKKFCGLLKWKFPQNHNFACLWFKYVDLTKSFM